MGPPSHKVRRARSKASAISQAYIPVGRNELRQLVRMRAVPVPSQGLQEPSSMEQQGSAELCEQHPRPVTAVSAAPPGMGPHSAAALDSRVVARAYEELVAQGTTPRAALLAARASVARVPRNAEQAERAETRRLRAMLAPRGIVNELARARMAAQAATDAAERELRHKQRPFSSRTMQRPYVATNEVEANLVSGSGSSHDPLLPFGYQTLGPIAQGSFSTVVRAKHSETKVVFAVKTYLMRAKGGRSPPSAESVKMELDCLEALKPSAHPNIANLVETHEGPYERHAILQYCGGGSLHRHLQSRGHGQGMDLAEAAPVLHQISAALAHMHDLGVAHRDVKPGNIVFNSSARESVCLVDFGFATIFRPKGSSTSRRLKTVLGTPVYMAPELVRGASYLGPPVDVWAFGCILYELLHNRTAFRAESHQDLNVRIMKGSHNKIAASVSSKCRKLLAKLLAVDVSDRITAADATTRIRDSLMQLAPEEAVSEPATQDWLTGM